MFTTTSIGRSFVQDIEEVGGMLGLVFNVGITNQFGEENHSSGKLG